MASLPSTPPPRFYGLHPRYRVWEIEGALLIEDLKEPAAKWLQLQKPQRQPTVFSAFIDAEKGKEMTRASLMATVRLTDVFGIVGITHWEGDERSRRASVSANYDRTAEVGLPSSPLTESTGLGATLIVVQGATEAGYLKRNLIAKVESVALIPFYSREYEDLARHRGAQAVKKLLSCGSFFFSYDYPLTMRAESIFAANQAEHKPGNSKLNVWEHISKQFYWNRHAASFFAKNQLLHWTVVLICGYVGVFRVPYYDTKIDFGVISRIECTKASSNLAFCGINDDFEVARFIETEQIIVCGDRLSSFIILRGSPPFFWEQRLIRGKHRPVISRGIEASMPAFKRHFEDLQASYKDQYIVHLHDPSDIELSQRYEQLLQTLPSKVQYLDVPYADLSKGPFAASLLDNLAEDLLRLGQFAIDGNGDPLLIQRGTFRISSYDCLDRVNMVQTAFGRRAFVMTLQMMGVWKNFDIIDLASDLNTLQLDDVIKQVWANNGTSISAVFGADSFLKKAFNSYFQDIERQVSLSLFLGFSTELVSGVDEQASLQLKLRESEFTETKDITIFVGTWNVNGQNPVTDLSPWLTFPKHPPPDIYVIGFQEIVQLTGKNVWNADEQNSQIWISAILGEINKRQKYVLLRTYQLVGIALFVFVKEDSVSDFREVYTEVTKMGFKGIAGNKGAISIRFNFHHSAFCFTCAHLAAGQSATEDRNKSFYDIMMTKFNGTDPIESHEFLFLFGDLNYRLEVSKEKERRDSDLAHIRSCLHSKDIQTLLRTDQLRMAKQASQAFVGFNEGPITFLPTYKFDVGTDNYDSSKKSRSPGWCDRILWKDSKDISQLQYGAAWELRSSDHKPVSALFATKVRVINKQKYQKVLEEVTASTTKPEGQSTNFALIDFADFESAFPTTSSANPKTSPFDDLKDVL